MASIDDVINQKLQEFSVLRLHHKIKVECFYDAINTKYVLRYFSDENPEKKVFGELGWVDIQQSGNDEQFVRDWFTAKFDELMKTLSDKPGESVENGESV